MRYRVAAQRVQAARPSSLLDYGAGDGKVLLDMMDALPTTTALVAYEPVEAFQQKLASAAARAQAAHRIDLVTDRDDLDGRCFDFILCLGVIEHMPLPERAAFYDVCERTLSPTGIILIDVPVEVGPTLLVKAIVRTSLKGRAREYGRLELLRACCGMITFDPGRFDASATGTWIHDHRGFDYRLLRRELAHRFAISAETATPVSAVPGPLGNQEIFFTCHLPEQAAHG